MVRVSTFSLLARARVAAAKALNGSITSTRSGGRFVQGQSTYVDRQGYEHFGNRPQGWGPTARLAAGGAGVGCFVYYWSCRQEVPYTHRHHAIMLISNKMELHIGQETFQQALIVWGSGNTPPPARLKEYTSFAVGWKVTQEAAMSHTLLPPNHPAVQLVKRVGTRIAQVASDGGGGGYYQHMKNLNWEFAVINSPDVNAFVAPGGKVVAFTGLLNLISTEDELAAVLAHEVGHVLARHHAERLSQLNVTGLVNMLARALLGIQIPGALVVLGMFLPYSRAAEYEADAIGIRLLAKACYDPQANITMLQKLNSVTAKQEARMPEILSTHPITQERVARVRKLLSEAYKLREENCTVLQDLLDQFSADVSEPVRFLVR